MQFSMSQRSNNRARGEPGDEARREQLLRGMKEEDCTVHSRKKTSKKDAALCECATGPGTG